MGISVRNTPQPSNTLSITPRHVFLQSIYIYIYQGERNHTPIFTDGSPILYSWILAVVVIMTVPVAVPVAVPVPTMTVMSH